MGCSVDTHQKQETTSTQPIKKEVQLPAYESPLDGLDINKLPGKSLEELQNLLYAIFIETKRSNNTQA
ncbi:TPA: hypothetical protein DEP21_01175 [Patescibacteria group bacterium]|nr:hypothetical protein [Candidatus Gracilibacteria bacterium]